MSIATSQRISEDLYNKLNDYANKIRDINGQITNKDGDVFDPQRYVQIFDLTYDATKFIEEWLKKNPEVSRGKQKIFDYAKAQGVRLLERSGHFTPEEGRKLSEIDKLIDTTLEELKKDPYAKHHISILKSYAERRPDIPIEIDTQFLSALKTR